MRGSWRPNKTAIYWPPLLWPSALYLSRSPRLLNRRPGAQLSAECWPSLPQLVTNGSGLETNFLSSPSYIIVQSPTQSLDDWSSSSGNNCHVVHRSLSSGESVYDCTAGFSLVPFCQPSSPTQMEYALPPSLEWHVWPGRRSVYNTRDVVCN